MTPLEDLARVQKRWQEIEICVRTNQEEGVFPFVLVACDKDYVTVQQVVEGMGLHMRRRPTRKKEGVIICLSPKDRRWPKVVRIILDGHTYMLTASRLGEFGHAYDMEKA